jgi:hypothetical protein
MNEEEIEVEDLPVVNGVHIIKVNNETDEDVQSIMDEWIEEHAHISTDPSEVVIFSPYDMVYELTNLEDSQVLHLTGFMAREKWATLADADDLRSFAFHLEKNHKNLKVKVTLALSVKEEYESDETFSFTQSYFEHNKDVKDMITQMHLDKKNKATDEDDDEKFFGGDES